MGLCAIHGIFKKVRAIAFILSLLTCSMFIIFNGTDVSSLKLDSHLTKFFLIALMKAL